MIITKTILSVIVPVYNVLPYLERCVHSVIQQTYPRLEIILVDDGSTDGSGELCDSLAAADGRIQVIHQQNGGVAVARNTGIGASTGEYIMLVDSDDYLIPRACEELLGVALETGADMVAFEAVSQLQPASQQVAISSGTGEVIVMNSREAGEHYLYGKYFQHSPWSKLYARRILEEVPFPPGLLAEDYAASYLHIQACRTVVHYDKTLYVYCIREGSTTTQGSFKLTLDVYKITCTKREVELNLYPGHRRQIETLYANCLLKTIARIYNEGKADTAAERADIEKRLSEIKFGELPFSTRLVHLLYRTNGSLFALFMKFVKKNA